MVSKKEKEVAEQAQRLLDGLLKNSQGRNDSKNISVDRELLRQLVASVKFYRAVQKLTGRERVLLEEEATERLIGASSKLADGYGGVL